MKLLFCLAAAAFCGVVHAQDMIVTTGGDTLQCNIRRIGKKAISFSLERNGNLLQGELPRSRISYFHVADEPSAVDTLRQDTVPVRPRPDKQRDTLNYPKVRWSMEGGFSYRTGKLSPAVPDFLTDYVESLRKGSHFGVHGTCFVAKPFGVGIRFNRYRASGQYEGLVTLTYDDGTQETGAVEDRITIFYVGPSISLRLLSRDQRDAVLFSFSGGWMHYRDEAVFVRDMTITSNTFGFAGGLDYETRLSGGVYVGVGVNYTFGALGYYDIESPAAGDRTELSGSTLENISRLDLSLGLRINL